MNTKTTLLMAIVALGIGGVLMVVKPWAPAESEDAEQTQVKALFKVDAEEVDRVELQRGDELLAFARTGSDWRLTKPFEAPATEYEVKTRLVEKAAGLKYTKTHAADSKDRPDAKLTGLDDPRAIVRLYTGEKLAGEVKIGQRLPTGKGSYIQSGSSDDVLESEEDLSNEFRTPLKNYRNKQVIKVVKDDIQKVTVQQGEGAIVLSQSDGEWMIEKPVRGRADKSRADQLVGPFASLYVNEFTNDNPSSLAPYGLDPPLATVTVEAIEEMPPKVKPGGDFSDPADTQPSMHERKYALLIGGPSDADGSNFFAKLDPVPWVFTISKYNKDQLLATLNELREKSLASVTPTRVIEVSAATPGGKYKLSKAEGKWTFEDGAEADTSAVDDLIKTVNELKAEDFADTSGTLLAIDWTNPRASISLTQEGSLDAVRVLVGPASASGKMVYVRNASEEAVAAVRAEEVEPLLASAVAYRDRTVIELPRERIVKMDVARQGSDAVTIAKNDNAAWRIVSPVDAPTDLAAVSNVLGHLVKLRAEQVVATGSLDQFGLNDPAVTVTAHVESLLAADNVKVVGEETEAAEESATTKPAISNQELLDYLNNLPEEKQNPKAREMLEQLIAEEKAASEQPADDEQVDPEAAEAALAELVKEEATPAEPAVTQHTLLIARKDGKVYGAVAGSDVVYELSEQVYDDAVAELHDRKIADFKVEDVTEVGVSIADAPLVFTKSGATDWKYQVDPLLPIDAEKVKQLINDIRDLKADRYVAYAASDLGKFGLGAGTTNVTASLKDGRRIDLRISSQGPEGDADNSRYATVADSNKVFLLKGEVADKFNKKLEDFEKESTS